jgi:hypothetical protein
VDYAQLAQANNPCMNEEYDPNKESSYIIPFDANNLYGYAMSQPLPSGEYEWTSPANITMELIKNVILKIDISKMDNLRNRHKNIQFDCLLRGYIGEYCIIKWLKKFNINFETTNYIEEDENIDIDFYYKEYFR